VMHHHKPDQRKVPTLNRPPRELSAPQLPHGSA
jgi:hypothetical protein